MFPFDQNAEFKRLTHPPIVEAVIRWHARAERPLEEKLLRATVAERIPRLTNVGLIQQIGYSTRFVPGSQPEVVASQGESFSGLRFSSADNREIVQFRKDGLIYSHTQGYDHWDGFVERAMQAWELFREIAKPEEVSSLGVRFINHIPAAQPANIHHYLRDPPAAPPGLLLADFVYQSTFDLPGRPFKIRIIQVMQDKANDSGPTSGLFLDIDVIRTAPVALSGISLQDALQEMRQLKNTAFFTLIADAAIESFSSSETSP